MNRKGELELAFALHDGKGELMQTLVIYDISHDGTRYKVADVCLDYGLDRVQYSAFLGRLSRNHQEELMLRVQERMGKHGGNIQLIPICKKDWKKRICIDVPEEKK